VDQKIVELIETMKRFRNSEVKKDQEIYACMLHSLFDEYRFLHKYPNPYLEKIAKLFGAVIKNRIMDNTL
jgi:CCR4-NOT transcription complex subunit 1